MNSDWKPEIGKRYQVHAEDCCLEVHFTSVVTGINEDGDAVFENGVTLGPDYNLYANLKEIPLDNS